MAGCYREVNNTGHGASECAVLGGGTLYAAMEAGTSYVWVCGCLSIFYVAPSSNARRGAGCPS